MESARPEASEKIIPNCNGQISDTAKFCKHCGSKIEQKPEFIFCEECGAKIEADAPFCEECGAKVGGPQEEDLWADVKEEENADPWASFADYQQPETVIVEKVVEVKKPESAPASKAEEKKDNLKAGLDFYQVYDYKSALECFLATPESKTSGEIQYRIAFCYSDLKDYKNTYIWLQKALNEKYRSAYNLMGWLYYTGNYFKKDIAEAAKWYAKGAKAGDRVAQCNLAWCYDFGEGVEQNINKAAKLYRQSAEQGYARAQYCLGWDHAHGYGTSYNHSFAVIWYQKAAEQNYPDAQYELGWHYENGKGVKKNKEEAVRWYKTAAENGNTKAKERLAQLGY